jgi:transcriptional regulator with XRE-family HTH domain
MSQLKGPAKKSETISARQVRAARQLLGVTQREVARLADVGRRALAEFECGMRTPQRRTLRDIRAGLEAAGIAFIDDGADGGGPGVRLRAPLGAAGAQDTVKGAAEDMAPEAGQSGHRSDGRSQRPD